MTSSLTTAHAQRMHVQDVTSQPEDKNVLEHSFMEDKGNHPYHGEIPYLSRV